MTSIFKNDTAKQTMLDWYERFRARLTVPTESRQVPTRFGDTHVLVGGPATAPPVVIVHGAMASSAHLLVELAALLETHRVYAVDVIGQSPKTPHARPSVKNNDYGIWLAEVLDGLGLQRVPLVALSWGGFVAVRLAAHAPVRIERLALLVPAGIVNGHALQGITRMLVPLMLWRMFPSPERFKKFARNFLTTLDDDWLPYFVDAFRSFHMDVGIPKLATPEELAAFKAPMLLICGDQDVSFPRDKLVRRARELFPSLAGTEVIPNCKHCPPTTDEFRGWLGGRLHGFLGGQASAAVAS